MVTQRDKEGQTIKGRGRERGEKCVKRRQAYLSNESRVAL